LSPLPCPSPPLPPPPHRLFLIHTTPYSHNNAQRFPHYQPQRSNNIIRTVHIRATNGRRRLVRRIAVAWSTDGVAPGTAFTVRVGAAGAEALDVAEFVAGVQAPSLRAVWLYQRHYRSRSSGCSYQKRPRTGLQHLSLGAFASDPDCQACYGAEEWLSYKICSTSCTSAPFVSLIGFSGGGLDLDLCDRQVGW
jgi:hypothetical protein